MADSGKVSLRPRGRFNAETTYERLDMVKYGSGLYIAIQTTTGNLPTDSSNWMNAMEYDIANMSQVGLVKPDGSSITADADGTLHANVSAGVRSFNYRDGDVLPATGDYTAAMIGYDGSDSSLEATNVEGAIDELDSKKTDTSVIAPVESGSTASKAYAIGQHFIRDNAFCTAIAAIAEGASFTLNTNYTAEDIASVISSLSSEITNLIKYVDVATTSDSSTGAIYLGRYVSNTIPLFAYSIVSGGGAKYIRIYSTTSGSLYCVQSPWADPTTVEINTSVQIRLFYLEI